MSINRIFKALLALFCTFALILSVTAVADSKAISLEGEEYVKVAESSGLELYVKPSTTGFKVVDTNSGESWESCRAPLDDDAYVGGVYMTEIQSLLAVEYYDSEGVMNSVNSYASSVMNGDFVLSTVKNGYRVEYNIESGLVELALEVRLENGVLAVDVLTSSIKIADGYSISRISVLPFFMVGTAQDNGYLLVPDGCGGLISFNEDKEGIAEYSRRVYGECISDDAVTLNDINEKSPVTLPTYGIKRNNGAILCFIENGDAMASINAYGAKRVSSFYNIYASFALYSNMEYSFSQDSVMIFEKNSIPLCDISEKFYFLNGEDADYNGMAKKLRSILIEDGTIKPTKTTLTPYITVYGGIPVKKSFFGFLVDSVRPLTTTEQLLEIVEKAKESGIDNPTVNYLFWNDRELKGKSANSLKINSKLSKGVSFKELNENKDFTFVPAVSNFFSYTKSDNIIQKFSSPASNIAGTALYKKKLSPTSFTEYGKRNYYLNKKYLNKNLFKFTKAVLKSDNEYIGLSDAVQLLYEDFGKSNMKRYNMQEIITDKLNVLAKEKKLLLDNPNFYGYKYADKIINLPTGTSGHLLIDKEIPFVQLVISGCIGYACEPLNYEDSDIALLKTLETGSMPHYYMYYEEESSVKNTEYSDLGSGDYEKNLEKFQSLYSELSKVYKKIGNAELIAHSCISDNVYKVTYNNGVKLYINYSDEKIVLDNGKVISAMGYITEVAQ